MTTSGGTAGEDVASSGETIRREEATALSTVHSRQVEEVDSNTVSADEMFARAEIGFPSADSSPMKTWEPAERPEVSPLKFQPESSAGASARRDPSVAIV